MRIESSTIGMDSVRTYACLTKMTSTTEMVLPKDTEVKKAGGFEFSLQNKYQEVSSSKSVSSVEEKKSMEAIKGKCMQYLLYWLFEGRSAKESFSFDEYFNSLKQSDANVRTVEQYFFSEEESTSFETTGTVNTADGRQISFQLELNMSRSFSVYYEQTYDTPLSRMMDPLVINLDSDIASLSDQKFEFDLDTDGVLEKISTLQSGSGFLSLDKNGDGKINSGNELFGTKSGDGFGDLSRYDEDGNGWIDEADSVFKKLMIWTKNEQGEDELYHLSEKGVGAICLQKVSTDFSLRNLRNNQLNGQIRSTGIFLYENGNTGTVQHLDVAT